MQAGGEARGRWTSALALGGAVLLLYTLDAFPLVALPLAVLLLALAPRRPGTLLFAGIVLLWPLALFPPLGAFGVITRGWALLLGGLLVLAVLLWPDGSFLSRALAALAAALLLVGGGLALSGSWGAVDAMFADLFRSALRLTSERLTQWLPESRFVAQFGANPERMAGLRTGLFPAFLALQSLAALALAWWALTRMAGTSGLRALRPLREFRFNDQLIWVMIAGLVLLVLPLGPGANRVALNLLVFMAALYALRGVAVFVFLAGRAPSLLSVVFGALAAIFLYPIVLTAALLVGLGDTWLDVRGRAVAAAGT